MSSEPAYVDLSAPILEREPPLPTSIEERPVRFTAPDGATITGIMNAPTNRPIKQKALFLHEIEGNADGGTVRVMAQRLARSGIATLRIDFSGHGDRLNEWERYSPQSMQADAVTSIDWMDKQWPNVEQTMLCGFSTGGAAAIMTRASDARVSKTCLLYPVLSFQYNFLAATYSGEELRIPKEDWDSITPWRAGEFTEEKLRASLDDDKPFSLSVHTYGAGFIKGCKEMVDEKRDILKLIPQAQSPLTIIQGTIDFIVPDAYARSVYDITKDETPIRLVRLKGVSHWIPQEWKNSVIKQFRKAAKTDPEDFKTQRTTISIRSEKDFFFPDPLPQ